MENCTEKNSSSTEKSNGNYATGPRNPLYDMFVTQLSRLHTVCAEKALARGFGQANLVRSIGETWFVEVKTAGGRLSALQKVFAEDMIRMNQRYVVVWNKESVDEWLLTTTKSTPSPQSGLGT